MDEYEERMYDNRGPVPPEQTALSDEQIDAIPFHCSLVDGDSPRHCLRLFARAIEAAARKAALVEAACAIELIGFDWRDAGADEKWYAVQYLRDELRRLAAQEK